MSFFRSYFLRSRVLNPLGFNYISERIHLLYSCNKPTFKTSKQNLPVKVL